MQVPTPIPIIILSNFRAFSSSVFPFNAYKKLILLIIIVYFSLITKWKYAGQIKLNKFPKFVVKILL